MANVNDLLKGKEVRGKGEREGEREEERVNG